MPPYNGQAIQAGPAFPYHAIPSSLTLERQQHIYRYHPDLIPFFHSLGEVLVTPDGIRRTLDDPQVLLFYKFYPDILGGKYLVVVVKKNDRSFILTAYLARRVKTGEPL